MRRIRLFLPLILMLALGFSVAATAASQVQPQTEEALNALVDAEAGLERGGFGAVLFSDQGEIWSYQSEPGDSTVPFNKQTPLLIGELSGRFVILAVAKLAGQRRLDLDKPLRFYLPELAGIPNLEKIGRMHLRSLVNEATGWVDAFPRALSQYRLEEDLLPALATRPSRYPEGLRQTHSGAMIDLLALVLERTQHKPWNQVLASVVFNPFGMSMSSYVTDAEAIKRAKYYFRDGSEFDPNVTSSLVLPYTPSASAMSSLTDLAGFGSSLLSALDGRPHGAISQAQASALFTPGIAGQLDRQGFESGMGWFLTEYQLGYLGRVAWAYGASVSHRTMILFLLDHHVGLVLASALSNPSGPAQIKSIALDLLQAYAATGLGMEKPSFRIPPTFPRIPEALHPVSGVYASGSGLALVDLDGDLLAMVARGSYSEFTWAGNGKFIPTTENEFDSLQFGPGNWLTITWRSGAKMNVVLQSPAQMENDLKPGAYRLEHLQPGRRLDTVLIDQLAGNWVITPDEGQSFLLVPEASGGMGVLCDESSILYGVHVSMDADGEVHIVAP
jgi:CubicO group peptidase (beta-lactamase class C family)